MGQIKNWNDNWYFYKGALSDDLSGLPQTESSQMDAARENLRSGRLPQAESSQTDVVQAENCQMGTSQADFVPVEIPHDWLIYNTENLYEDGCGWYRKRFENPSCGGRRVQVRFDGVYMDSTVYVNRKKAWEWKYGYSTFTVDITDFLQPEENELLVQVRHQAPNSRWYSGAGIYRNVWLKVCEPAYLPFDGTYISTKRCGEDFLMDIHTEAAGILKDTLCCRYRLWRQGKLVQELGCAGISETLAEQVQSAVFDLRATVEHPLLWDVDSPECYELTVELLDRDVSDRGASDGDVPERNVSGGDVPDRSVLNRDVLDRSVSDRSVPDRDVLDKSASDRSILDKNVRDRNVPDGNEPDWDKQNELCCLDSQRITVGFRTMEFDPQGGFYLNGRYLKVHGVCEHHDFGCLGSAFSVAAMRRKLVLLRKMGVNAIRTSHNMPASEVMDLADRMGFLVLSEAFDMWERSKTTYDYARFFPEWAERDVASWVRRDRNHPSLFLWSIGNEIYDTHADEHGQELTKRLLGFVKKHDSAGNAPVTVCSNYMPWENARKCADIVKFAGYNYGEKYYDEHHKEHPDWVIYGSETASVVQSRGIYHFPLSQPNLSEEDEQCSAMGNSSTSWGAKNIEACIIDDRDAEYCFGQFLWSGFDYIGEPTPYHTKNSYFGQLDTAGFPKDAYFMFQAEWTDVEKAPMVHLFPYWDFNPGQQIDMRACTNGAAVELFVNGVSQGRQEIDHLHGKKLLGDWQVEYVPGTVTAVAYDKDGREIARESRYSFGDSKKIMLTADRTELTADAKDLCFVTIETQDAAGHPVENAVDYVKVSITGEGRLLGLDNGDSTDFEPYKTDTRKLFSGKLLAVVGTTHQEGEITVRVTGEGLEAAELHLVSHGSEGSGYLENFSGSGRGMPQDKPVRKVELTASDGQQLTDGQRELMVQARIFPADAGNEELCWRAVNRTGIEVAFASVEEVSVKDGIHTAIVTARGDGDFFVRCMAKNRAGHVTVISQLECYAKGLGQAFLNPYHFISAGLYTEAIGEIGNGNEKGIATARDGASGIIFKDVDFGEFGSDELTMSVFALSGEAYPVEVWLGIPPQGTDGNIAKQEQGSGKSAVVSPQGTDGNTAKQEQRTGKSDMALSQGADDGTPAQARKLATLTYQKPSIWNTYQEETWKLPERISGVTTISFVLHAKVHIKGFSFRRKEKAWERLYAGEADSVYGDSFVKNGKTIEGIGNNVTLAFLEMDFGMAGTDSISLCGYTPLACNTIHICFTGEDGRTERRIVEFAGESSTGNRNVEFTQNDTGEQVHSFEPLYGKGKVEFVFLPGSSFDFESFQFIARKG